MDRIFTVLPLLVLELLTFNVYYCLLNDDSYEVGEILGVRLERNVISKIQNYGMMKPYFHIYLCFLSRQLDNDDTNGNENDTDIFSWTNTEHMKYHKENNLYTMK